MSSKQTNVRISKTVFDLLQGHCKRTRYSQRGEVDTAVLEHLEKQGEGDDRTPEHLAELRKRFGLD